jgi:hypothetical protein
MAHHSHVVCIPASLFDSQGSGRGSAGSHVALNEYDLAPLAVRTVCCLEMKRRVDFEISR